MSLLDIELVNPKCVAIKTEEIKDDISFGEDFKFPGNSDVSYLVTSSTKCGEIFTSNNTEFTLICVYCEDSYDTINDFGEHLRQKHIVSDQKDEVDYDQAAEADENTSEHSFHDVDELLTGSGSEDYSSDPDDNNFVFPCKYCNKQYRSKATLRRHKCQARVESKLANSEDAQLDDCAANKKESMKAVASKISCNLCHKEYRTQASFERHKCRARTDGKSKTNAQDVLNESASNDAKEEEQENSDDPPNTTERSEESRKMTNPDLYCEICDRQFKYKNIFKKHGMQHPVPPVALQKDPEYLKCRYCGIKVNNNDEWYRHENSHTELTPYQCAYCPKRFKSRLEVDMHTNSHTGNRPFKCEQCGASFAHSNNLSTHIKRVHLKLTPFSCSVCDKKFLRNVELRIHMRQHTGERPYQCEECGRSFMIAVQLNEHRKKHTNVRDVKCPVCPMAFFTKKMLRKHMVKHSDERPHVCSICGRTFSRKKALHVHNKIHQDFKEYVCAICGKAFAQPAGLYSHKKSHINTMDAT